MNTLCIVSFLLITSLIHAINSWNLDDVEPIVQTRYGQLRGRRSALPKSISSDVRISSFIGVPYAQPPIGINRFSASYHPHHHLHKVILINFNRIHKKCLVGLEYWMQAIIVLCALK